MIKVIEEKGEWIEKESGAKIHGMNLYKQHCCNPNCEAHRKGTLWFFPAYYISSSCPKCKRPLNAGRFLTSEYIRLSYHIT